MPECCVQFPVRIWRRCPKNLVPPAEAQIDKLQVLTNSLAATDVGVVYSGYTRYREQLLRGGVRIYELKPAALPEQKAAAPSPGVGGSRGGSSSSAAAARSLVRAARSKSPV